MRPPRPSSTASTSSSCRATSGGPGGKRRRGEEPPTVRKVTQGLVGNVRQALAGLAALPAHTAQPAWLEGEPPFAADEVLAAANGLVHLRVPTYLGIGLRAA